MLALFHLPRRRPLRAPWRRAEQSRWLEQKPGVSLFNHFIRPEQQRRRDGEAERLGGLEVDDKFERGRLLHWEVARLGALEDLVDIGRGAAEVVTLNDPIRQKTTRFGVLPLSAVHWHATLCGEVDDPSALDEEHRATEDKEGARLSFRGRRNGTGDLRRRPGL